MNPETSDTAASTFASELVAGLIGAGVALGCVLPPILHLVTGPLGPFIGGFVAANRAGEGARARAVVALTVATGLAGFVTGLLSIARTVAAANELPDWFPSTPARIAVVGTVVWAYAALLATIGAVVRGSVGQKN